jgi:hypothetical protein
MYRYWDGSAWSDVVSPHPLAGPPSQYVGATAPAVPAQGVTPGAAPGFDPTQPLTRGAVTYIPLTDSQGAGQTSGSYDQSTPASYQPLKKPRRTGLWVTLGVGVVVLALIIFGVTRLFNLFNASSTGDPGAGVPGAPEQTCPSRQAPVRFDHPSDGRVYGGDLSYPRLGRPWSAPDTDNRVPFGRDVAEQEIMIHENTSGQGDWAGWVVSVLVGQLYAGDGFYAPQEASDIVNRCIFGEFYGNTTITQDVQRSEAYSVDGYDGWITETNLSFSIPGLATTSELAIVIIVATGEMTSSIFYASVPNDATQYQSDVDAAIAGLKVTPK